jgi:hypothetical protein
MGWIRRRRISDSAEEIAEQLYKVVVAEGVGEDLRRADLFRVCADQIPRLTGLLKIHRKAVVLLVLTQDAKQDLRSEKILRAYRSKILGSQYKCRRKQEIAELEGAVASLYSLLQPDFPLVSWASKWLLSADIKEENPIILSLISNRWMNILVAMKEALDRVKEF